MSGQRMPRGAYPIHECVEYPPDGEPVATPCACRYPTSHPWPPHGGESGRRLLIDAGLHIPSSHPFGLFVPNADEPGRTD